MSISGGFDENDFFRHDMIAIAGGPLSRAADDDLTNNQADITEASAKQNTVGAEPEAPKPV